MLSKVLLLLSLVLFIDPGNHLKIMESWMRPGAKGMATALYFTVENTSENADTLYDVNSRLAAKVEIHETYKKNDMMGMRKVEFIVIPAKSTFYFKPGAHHIMLMKLKDDLKAGAGGEVSLFFKSGGEIKLNVRVKKN